MYRPRRLASLFLTMAALLVSSAVLSHEMGRIVVAASDEVQRRHRWSARLAETIATVREAESGQRGFLITGRDYYLRPYERAAARIDAELDEFRSEAARSPEFQAGLTRLRALIDDRMADLAASLPIRRQQGFDAAANVFDTDRGARLMAAIHTETDALNKLDDAELADAQYRVQRATLLRNGVLVVMTAIEIAFLTGVYRRIVRDRKRREQATAEIHRQRELLSVTLASIGDAVIVTDVDRRITFVNPVAEQLLKTSAAESVGRPCEEVFKLIDEETRQPLESPIRQVIETGRRVGLSGQALLVRPDGSELPIDDAGSPVLDETGALRGVVLIFRDFSAHRENAARMLAANAELAEANRAKDQFTAMLSHELRTPLTPVLGTLMAWEQNPGFPAEFVEELKMIRWNVELETRLIDDLLEMTRIKTGKLSLNRETIDVHETIGGVIKMYARELAEKRIDVRLSLAAPRCHAWADNARLHQVFWNILKNAVKFTPKGGTVAIQSSCVNGTLRIEFKDSGIGMTPELLGRIFRPLEQGSPEITRRFGGLGLGMAISKTLVEAQDGMLVASSAGIGSGSSFTVNLPAVDAPAPVAVPQGQPASAAQRSLHILLVEDHPDTATVLRLLLKRAGHDVDVATSVAAAVSTFGQKPFDLLLSDLGLPDGTGIDLMKKIRESSTVPAVALTGYGMDEDVARCIEAGFNRHLTKPVNIHQLVAVIKELLPA